MSLLESSIPNIEGEMEDMEMKMMMDALFSQDVDMGVCRDFYDPLYPLKQQKQREQELIKIDSLRKKLAQHEAQYYTIDHETGEKIPTSGVSHPPLLEKQSSLAKDLDELGRMINIDELDISSYLIDQPQQPQQVPVQQIQPQPQEVYQQPPQQQQQQQHLVPQLQNEHDPWQTTVEWYDMDTGFQPYAAQSDAAGSGMYPAGTNAMVCDNSTTEPADYFSFMNSQDSSSSEEMMPNFDVDMVFGESSDSNYLPFSQESKPAVGGFNTLPFGNSLSSQTNTSGSDSSEMGAPSTPASSYHSSDGMNSGSGSESSMAKQRRNANRDEERCKEMEVPFSVEVITNCPVEQFNMMLRDYNLSEEQLNLVKDIRRRGKNKVAAQNCRKKKQSELSGLEEEIDDLKKRRNALVRDKTILESNKNELEMQMGRVYEEIFFSLRDESGEPYDPRYFELHVTEDGEVEVRPKFYSMPPKFEMNTSAAYTLLDLSMKG